MITKVVIPSAGLGSRLLPTTKEQPKEMLPIFARGHNGQQVVKPVIQLIFEQLYDYGLREYCFVVGRGKRAIEDHFTQDPGYVLMLRKRLRRSESEELEKLYSRLRHSTTFWVNQSQPRGFGDAVMTARPFIRNEEFMVHAGDTYVISRDSAHLDRLLKTHRKFNSAATFLVRRTRNAKIYGVIDYGNKKGSSYKVTRVVEKPKKPPSDLAIVAIYMFQPCIFDALHRVPVGKGGEVQLTDGIQALIDSGFDVYAVELLREENWLDIGGPETYWEALRQSYRNTTSVSAPKRI